MKSVKLRREGALSFLVEESARGTDLPEQDLPALGGLKVSQIIILVEIPVLDSVEIAFSGAGHGGHFSAGHFSFGQIPRKNLLPEGRLRKSAIQQRIEPPLAALNRHQADRLGAREIFDQPPDIPLGVDNGMGVLNQYHGREIRIACEFRLD
jgi:hypothetical protein